MFTFLIYFYIVGALISAIIVGKNLFEMFIEYGYEEFRDELTLHFFAVLVISSLSWISVYLLISELLERGGRRGNKL